MKAIKIILSLTFVLLFTTRSFSQCGSCCGSNSQMDMVAAYKEQTISFAVNGIKSTEHADKINAAIVANDLTITSRLSTRNGKLVLRYDPKKTTKEKITTIIKAAAGSDVKVNEIKQKPGKASGCGGCGASSSGSCQ